MHSLGNKRADPESASLSTNTFLKRRQRETSTKAHYSFHVSCKNARAHCSLETRDKQIPSLHVQLDTLSPEALANRLMMVPHLKSLILFDIDP